LSAPTGLADCAIEAELDLVLNPGSSSEGAERELDGPPVHLPGHQLAPGYVVVEHVRRGEDLDSYEAWSCQRYCRCFIKTLRPDLTTDASARRQLLREARLLLSLTHPHLVRAYEYVKPQPGQPPLLVMENLTGATLSYLLDGGRRRLSTADLGHLGQHLCSALRYLHSRGYLHLDVKPSNIIASHGIARLIDLSLTRPPGYCPAGTGTPGYMSPEQLTGGNLGPPTDVWGVGLVLYQAATGIQPFDMTHHTSSAHSTISTMACCRRQLARRAPKIRAHRRLPPDIAHTIDACLHPDPHHRPTLDRLYTVLAVLTDFS
jgi:serine/threonine protein kinase